MPWLEVTLGDICEFKYGKSLPAASRVPGDVDVYGSNGVVGSHTRALTTGPTIVVGRKGSFGEVNYSPGACWPIDTTYYIDETATPVDLRWLAHLLPTLRLTELNRAAAVPGLNREDAYRRSLLLPPVEEQRRIAAILDQADALRAKRREALTLLDDLAQSIFIDMFGDDRARFPLGDHLRFVTSGGRGWAKYYAEQGEVFIRSLDVRMNRITLEDAAYVSAPDNAEARRTRTEAGDVLLTITGSRIGRAAPLSPELAGSYVSQHVAILRPAAEALRPEFLSFMLCMPNLGQRLIAQSQYGQTKPGLNFKQIREFLLPLPPVERQDDFLERRRSIETLRGSYTNGIYQFDEFLGSAQARAFSGRL